MHPVVRFRNTMIPYGLRSLFSLSHGFRSDFSFQCGFGSCSSSNWCKSATTVIETLNGSILILGLSKLYYEHLRLLNFDCDAELDPAFDFDADPPMTQILADPDPLSTDCIHAGTFPQHSYPEVSDLLWLSHGPWYSILPQCQSFSKSREPKTIRSHADPNTLSGVYRPTKSQTFTFRNYFRWAVEFSHRTQVLSLKHF